MQSPVIGDAILVALERRAKSDNFEQVRRKTCAPEPGWPWNTFDNPIEDEHKMVKYVFCERTSRGTEASYVYLGTCNHGKSLAALLETKAGLAKRDG